MFEGLFGSKEAATSNMLEDIIEDLDKARQNASGDHTAFARILVDKIFGTEPQNLKATLA